MSVAPVLRRFSAVTALTAIGTSESAWFRRVAVMMMLPVSTGCRSSAWFWTAAPCAVDPCVGGAVVGLPLSVLGGTLLWAKTGVATAIRPADAKKADLRIMLLSPPRASDRPVRLRLTPKQARREAPQQ